jgi:signal peptidase II
VKGKSGFALAAIVFVVDQLTKWWVAGPLGLTELGQNIPVLPFFDLTRVHNEGISYGFLAARDATGRWLLVAMTAAIAGAVGWWLTREEQRADRLALGLVLGGALGNIVDRVRFGYVFDFADLHIGTIRPFAVFNVADACISIGVVILILRAFLIRDAVPEEKLDDA